MNCKGRLLKTNASAKCDDRKKAGSKRRYEIMNVDDMIWRR